MSVQYGYDADGRLETVTDLRGEVTTYEYDTLNRLTAVVDPEGIMLCAIATMSWDVWASKPMPLTTSSLSIPG